MQRTSRLSSTICAENVGGKIFFRLESRVRVKVVLVMKSHDDRTEERCVSKEKCEIKIKIAEKMKRKVEFIIRTEKRAFIARRRKLLI